jgi:hypothetical protein
MSLAPGLFAYPGLFSSRALPRASLKAALLPKLFPTAQSIRGLCPAVFRFGLGGAAEPWARLQLVKGNSAFRERAVPTKTRQRVLLFGCLRFDLLNH